MLFLANRFGSSCGELEYSLGPHALGHFSFKNDLKVKKYDATLQGQRMGRLLPPFLTRLLERYAAYAHRPGIPRVPSALIPVPVVAKGA